MLDDVSLLRRANLSPWWWTRRTANRPFLIPRHTKDPDVGPSVQSVDLETLRSDKEKCFLETRVCPLVSTFAALASSRPIVLHLRSLNHNIPMRCKLPIIRCSSTHFLLRVGSKHPPRVRFVLFCLFFWLISAPLALACRDSFFLAAWQARQSLLSKRFVNDAPATKIDDIASQTSKTIDNSNHHLTAEVSFIPLFRITVARPGIIVWCNSTLLLSKMPIQRLINQGCFASDSPVTWPGVSSEGTWSSSSAVAFAESIAFASGG